MSYTPFARWRNFTLENLKSMLDLYPDLLDKTSRNTVADNIEDVFPGYKKTAYQFGCQLGIESRAEQFTSQNYLHFLSDTGLEKYLGFWFKMYVCPNPYVNSSDAPICPFVVIAQRVVESPEHKISYTQFCNDAFGEGKSIDIFKNALIAWGKPLRVVGDEISIAADKLEELKKLVAKVESTLPMKNSKDVNEFFERFDCQHFMSFYDLTTIDSYKKEPHTGNSIFEGFKPWLTSYNNPDYTGTQRYNNYSNALLRLVGFMFEKELIGDANLNDLDVDKYYTYLDAYAASDEVREFDQKKLGSGAGIAALKKYKIGRAHV